METHNFMDVPVSAYSTVAGFLPLRFAFSLTQNFPESLFSTVPARLTGRKGMVDDFK